MDENKTVETSVDAEDKVAEAEQVGSTETDETDEQTVNETFDDGGDGKTHPDEAKPKQTKEQNAEFARKRREAERQAELKKAKVEATIDALGGINPYTNEPIKDEVDVEEYFMMRELKAQGKDPSLDIANYRKEKEREAIANREEEAKKMEYIQKDRDDFKKEYPDVKMDDLLADETFREYAEGKVGQKPMAEIYKGYQALLNKARETAEKKVAQTIANGKATTGSLKSPSQPAEVFYTVEQVQAMTPEERFQNYEKIKKSMAGWQIS